MKYKESDSKVLSLDTEQELSSRFSGKLLLQTEIPLQAHFFKELLGNGYFSSTPSIKRNKLSYECQRCHNQKTSLFGTIPCQSCDKNCVYCRKCIEMGRVIECELLYYWSKPLEKWPKLNDTCIWNGKLTEQQDKAAQRIITGIQNIENELLVWGVCGAGKTEMLYPGIAEALKLGKRVCLATPRADVVRELLPRFKASFSGLEIQGLYGGSEDKDGITQLLLATTHQLLRFKSTFDVLIIDEVDAFPYHNDSSLPFAAQRAKQHNSTTIYLTATPRKQQKQQILTNELPHVFVPVRFHGHPLPIPQLKMTFTLQKDLANFIPPQSFINDLKQREMKERQILLFVPTIELALKLKMNLTNYLIDALIILNSNELESVHAEDPTREEKVEHFRNKNIKFLITTTILERGVTFPSIDVFVLDAGHHVFDEAALVQIAGRAGRSPDDPTGKVVFYHDGKTKAMVQAIKSIKSMNKRGGFI